MEATCASCRFLGYALEDSTATVCRRFPPTLVRRLDWLVSEFPGVPLTGWCGEWLFTVATPATDIPEGCPPGLISHQPLSRRNQAILRDGPYCRYCGTPVGPSGSGLPLLTLDHLLPTSRGGTDEVENLAVSCTHCNNRKGSRTLEEYGVPLRASQPLRLAG